MCAVSVVPGLQYGEQSASITNQGAIQVGQDLKLGAQLLSLTGELEAGRDIVLQGSTRQLSDASYIVGGYLFTQDLSGVGIDLLIPHEHVIIANGDVELNENYTGPSLFILAGGRITQSEEVDSITINDTLARSVMSATISDGKGGKQLIILTSNNQPAVDLRSGIDWEQLGEAPGNINSTDSIVLFGNEIDNNAINGQGIALGDITNTSGSITLLSQDEIIIRHLDSSSNVGSPDLGDVVGQAGGNITLLAKSGIDVGDLRSSSRSVLERSTGSSLGNVTGGDGGTILLLTDGNVRTEDLISFSESKVERFFGPTTGNVSGGDGGSVIIFSGGSIDIERIRTFAESDSDSGKDITSGNGGDIYLFASNNINIRRVATFSVASSLSGDVIGGNGGNLFLLADANINSEEVEAGASSFSGSGQVTGGNGGDIYFSSGGNIEIRELDIFNEGSLISRVESFSGSGDVLGGNSGNVTLLADGDINTRSLVLFSDTVSFVSGNVAGGNGGDVLLVAGGDINTERIGSNSDARNSISLDSEIVGYVMGGNGGDVNLSASNNANVESISSSSESFSGSALNSTSGDVEGGNGGNVSLFAANEININSVNSLSFADADMGNIVGGNGGHIALRTLKGSIQPLSRNESSRVSELSSVSFVEAGQSGDGGNIFLEASNLRDLEIFTLSSFGRSGSLQINGLGDLVIDGSNVITSKQIEIELPGLGPVVVPVGGQGQSGDVNISSSGGITFINSTLLSDTNSVNPAGDYTITSPGWIIFNDSSVNTDTSNIGQAGNIEINASQGVLFTGVDSQLLAQTVDVGRAGSITINAPEVIFQEEAQISTSTTGTGRGGDIEINSQNLELIGQAKLIALSNQQGRAGNINLNISDTLISLNGDISTISEISGGGEIIVNSLNVRLFGDSDIQSFVNSGVEGGGNITFNGDTIVALDDSDILSFSADGRGGDITFNTAFFGEDYEPGSPPPFDGNDRVDVNASGAINGVISIPDVSFIENSLNELSDDLVNPEAITVGSCIVRNTEAEGSFTVTGTDGLPIRPDDTAASNFPAVAIEALSTETAQPPIWNLGDPIVEPVDAYTFENGRILLGRHCSSY
ncbi:MAG: hypothetical protein AAF572_09635 [Cyanobacteria bacterium P01_B01_bin.77]